MADPLNPADKTAAESDYQKKFNRDPQHKGGKASQDLKQQEAAGDASWKTATKKTKQEADKKGRFKFAGGRGGKAVQRCPGRSIASPERRAGAVPGAFHDHGFSGAIPEGRRGHGSREAGCGGARQALQSQSPRGSRPGAEPAGRGTPAAHGRYRRSRGDAGGIQPLAGLQTTPCR